jgi:hypothetical protein
MGTLFVLISKSWSLISQGIGSIVLPQSLFKVTLRRVESNLLLPESALRCSAFLHRSVPREG